MKVLYDKDNGLPGWSFTTSEGTTKGAEGNEGVPFTIDAWQEGRYMWPRLIYTGGPAIDLSGYTKVIFEIENPSATAQSVCVAVKANPEDNASVGALLPPKAVTQVVQDISDGAPLDPSGVRELFVYIYQPLIKADYVLKKITAVANPDYISKRVALGQQIEEAKRGFQTLKQASRGETGGALQALEEKLSSLNLEYEQRTPGYAIPVQKALLEVQNSVARGGMDMRAADLWLWTSPLGLAIREGTLPSPANPALTAVNDTICLNQYKAICVNISAAARPQKVRLKLTGTSAPAGLFSLRPTLFAKARDSSMTADAIGRQTGQLDLEVDAYQSQQAIVWIDTKRPGLRAGSYKASLQVSVNNGSQVVRNIPLNVKIAGVRLAAALPLSISNWAYFYMGSTKVSDGIEKETVANLRDYGANTWNMDYSQVPMPVLDVNGRYTGLEPATLKRLEQLMELLKGRPEEAFVIWLGFQRREIREALSKPGVLKGYLHDLHVLLDKYKVALDKRYIMFWDEPRLPEMLETLEWMKKTRALDPTFKFYENGSYLPDDPKAFNDYIKITDRWFPNWDQFYVVKPEDGARMDALNIPGMGFYRCLMSRNNRGVNIYEYYRLMGWYTMEHGFETLCFWVHNVGAEDVWDGTTGSSSGGIVVYKKDGKLLTSRRWELFREGLDDYKLAQAAFGTKGVLNAKANSKLLQICRQVSNRPADFAGADAARLKLIALAVKQPKTKAP